MTIDRYDPYDATVLADPQPYFRWLRDEHPVYLAEPHGYYVLSRFEDVHAALRNHEVFSSAKGNAPEPGWQPGLIGKDPPKHTRLRRLIKGVFTPKKLAENWAERIQSICDRLVDAARDARAIDGFEGLTLPLPIQVIAEMLGVRDGDLVEFKRWSDHMCEGVNQHIDPTIRARTAEAFKSLYGYFTQQVAERRARPRADLITLLCEAGEEGDRLSDKELIEFSILLLIAGNETTTNLVGNGLIAVLERPKIQDALRAAPEKIPDAIEEMLRFCPSTQSVFRHTTRDFELHGTTIPADSRVMLSLASANRDGRKYEAPDEFRLDRGMVEHVAFSSGIHFCLGSALARMEARTLFTTLLSRTKSVRLAGEPRFASSIVVRGPIELPIEVEPN
jgi:cytochrome P450